MRGREIWSWDWRGGLHVGLLVERFSRYVMLLHLSHDAKPIGDLRPDPGRAAQAQQASRLADLAPRGRDDRLKLPPLRWLVFTCHRRPGAHPQIELPEASSAPAGPVLNPVVVPDREHLFTHLVPLNVRVVIPPPSIPQSHSVPPLSPCLTFTADSCERAGPSR